MSDVSSVFTSPRNGGGRGAEAVGRRRQFEPRVETLVLRIRWTLSNDIGLLVKESGEKMMSIEEQHIEFAVNLARKSRSRSLKHESVSKRDVW